MPVVPVTSLAVVFTVVTDVAPGKPVGLLALMKSMFAGLFAHFSHAARTSMFLELVAAFWYIAGETFTFSPPTV